MQNVNYSSLLLGNNSGVYPIPVYYSDNPMGSPGYNLNFGNYQN